MGRISSSTSWKTLFYFFVWGGYYNLFERKVKVLYCNYPAVVGIIIRQQMGYFNLRRFPGAIPGASHRLSHCSAIAELFSLVTSSNLSRCIIYIYIIYITLHNKIKLYIPITQWESKRYSEIYSHVMRYSDMSMISPPLEVAPFYGFRWGGKCSAAACASLVAAGMALGTRRPLPLRCSAWPGRESI